MVRSDLYSATRMMSNCQNMQLTVKIRAIVGNLLSLAVSFASSLSAVLTLR
jgi:hypothetical protein